MNEKFIDAAVRDADPYAATDHADLRGAKQALLEDIMSTESRPSHAPQRNRWRRPLVGGLVAAAAVTALALAVPKDSSAPPLASPDLQFTSAAVKVAQKNPRLLIDEPGWKVTTVYGFEQGEGTVWFSDGKRDVEINWYPAASYDGYYQDRLDVSKAKPTTVAGQEALQFRYSGSDLEAMLPAEGTTFAMIRTGMGFENEAEILDVFAKIQRVDVEQWLSAMPPEVVVPGEAERAVKQMLADVPLPPGFDADASSGGVNTRYHLGVELVQHVECGWLAEWKRADEAGDEAAVQTAVDAVKSAKNWAVMDDLDTPDGEYAEGPLALADEAAVGQNPLKHMERFGCSLDN